MTISTFINSSRIGSILRHHGWALVVACIVALMAGLPQVIVRGAIGPLEQGVPYLVNDSEGEYLSRVREVLDGHYRVASPTLLEYKDSIVLMPPYGEILFYAAPTLLSGLSLETIVFLSKFILPALLFLSVYLCTRELLEKKDSTAQIAAILSGLLVVLAYDAYDYRHFIQTVVHGSFDPAGLLWNRLVHPITGGIVLFAFLWQVFKVVLRTEAWTHVIAAGLVLAVTPGYFFAFGLSMSIAICLMLGVFVARQHRRAFRVFVVLGIALLLNGPYLVNALAASHGAAQAGDAFRSGMFATRVPLLNLVSLVTLIGVLTVWGLVRMCRWDYQRQWWLIAGAVSLAMVLAYNQQLVTGRAVWPQHFVQYTTPLSMMLVVVVLNNVFRDRVRWFWRLSTSILTLVVIIFGWRGFQSASASTITKYTELQSFAGVLEYIRSHAQKDCVVYAYPAYPSEINRFIPSLTSCNDYHSFYIYSGVPRERILHNYLVNLRLRGLTVRDVREHFYRDPFYSTSYFFRDWNDMLCNNLSGCGDPWQIQFSNRAEIDSWFARTEQEIETSYKEFLTKDFYQELTRYQLDYVLVDRRAAYGISEQTLPFLRQVYSDDTFVLYELLARPS